MSAILDLIDKIRERPGIMLGRPSARTLYAFLSGYAYALKDTDPEAINLLAAFNKWVHNRYEVTSTQGWAKILEFYSMKEADEMALFWKLFDEFSKARPRARKKVS